MKKVIYLFSLAFIMFGVNLAHANDSYLSKLNGHSWQQSTPQEKLAFIVGMDGVVAIEVAIDQKQEEKAIADKTPKQKWPKSTVSKFERAWSSVFDQRPRTEIVEQIDTFYANNPTKLDRNVFEVIWYELLVPKYKGA